MPQTKFGGNVSHISTPQRRVSDVAPRPAPRVSDVAPKPAPDGVSSHEAGVMLAALEQMKQQLQALEQSIAKRPSAPPMPKLLEVTPRDKILSTLEEAGEMSTVDLMDRCELTKQQVHWYVDSLEEQGLTETVRGKVIKTNGRQMRGPDVVRYIGPVRASDE